MKTLWPLAVALLIMVPSLAVSQSDAEDGDFAEPETEQGDLARSGSGDGDPIRPGDEDGSNPPSDGLAECASILVVASEKSRNFIARKNMSQVSQDWFAEAGLLALDEVGEVPGVEIWEAKVSDWSGRIGSVDAMARHPDWMAYCSALGAGYGLDVSHFADATE